MVDIIRPFLKSYPYDVNMYQALEVNARTAKREKSRETSKDLMFCIALVVKKMKIDPAYLAEIGDFCLRMVRATQKYGSFKITINRSMSPEAKGFYNRFAPLFHVYEMFEKICVSFQETKKTRGQDARKGGYGDDLGEYYNKK